MIKQIIAAEADKINLQISENYLAITVLASSV